MRDSQLYIIEELLSQLKSAREQKGWSQKELSTRAGVPQSHISKIENQSVDLRLSSFSAIVLALDLEVFLVPKSAVTTIQSVVQQFASPVNLQVKKELYKLSQEIDKLQLKFGKEQTQSIDLHFGIISKRIHLLNIDSSDLRRIRTSVKAVLRSHDVNRLSRLEHRLAALSESLKLPGNSDRYINHPQPRYQLSEYDDESH